MSIQEWFDKYETQLNLIMYDGDGSKELAHILLDLGKALTNQGE